MAIPVRPGPILVPSVPCRIGPGRAETDFLATSDTLGERQGIAQKGVRAIDPRNIEATRNGENAAQKCLRSWAVSQLV